MKSIIDFFRKFVWEISISIVSTFICYLFTFIWEFADKTWEISLRSIIVFLCFMLLTFWIILLFISFLSHFKEMNHKRRLYKSLAKYMKNHEVVKSIQFYSITRLLNPDKYNDENIEIKIERVGGITAKAFETNCILNDSYVISQDFYIRYYYEVFETIKDIDHKIRIHQRISPNNLFYALEKIENCCSGIMNDYLNISSVNDIKPEHYFYYRTLSVLANKGSIYGSLLNQMATKERFLLDGKSCKIDRVLVGKTAELEDALKYGKHSQYISSIMTEELFVFFHEPNSYKSNRSYFSSILNSSTKTDNQLMVVTLDYDCLSVLTEYDAIVSCEKIHNNICDIVNSRKRENYL